MIREVRVRRVLNRRGRRDEWFLDEYSVNPYVGCGFNCAYCYVYGGRYGGAGKGLVVKVNAGEVLARELYRLAWRGLYGFIALSSATEPWMRVEERYGVTRRCLEAILRHRFPVHCMTKSPLILRDVDVLEAIDREAKLPVDLKSRVGRGVLVTFSLSTLDDRVARAVEPGAPRPRERLKALWRLREEGFKAGLALIPVLPFISDRGEGLESLVRAAREYDASYVLVGSLTLHGECRRRYYRALSRIAPELLSRYDELYRGRGVPGRSYERMLELRARRLCERYGVKYRIC